MKKFCCKTAEGAAAVLENEEISESLSYFFKIFSEPIRIKILLALLHGEICVNSLSLLLDVSQPRVSNQLKILKLNKIIKSRKEKNKIYYSLNDSHIHDILSIGLEHLSHQ